jgi:hypothetical protein
MYIVSDSGRFVIYCKPQFFIMFIDEALGVTFNGHV